MGISLVSEHKNTCTCITLINAGMQTKNKVRDNIINEAESNNKNPRFPLARSESSSITRIYDGTTLTKTRANDRGLALLTR